MPLSCNFLPLVVISDHERKEAAMAIIFNKGKMSKEDTPTSGGKYNLPSAYDEPKRKYNLPSAYDESSPKRYNLPSAY